jgi:hypothetical protein
MGQGVPLALVGGCGLEPQCIHLRKNVHGTWDRNDRHVETLSLNQIELVIEYDFAPCQLFWRLTDSLLFFLGTFEKGGTNEPKFFCFLHHFLVPEIFWKFLKCGTRLGLN